MCDKEFNKTFPGPKLNGCDMLLLERSPLATGPRVVTVDVSANEPLVSGDIVVLANQFDKTFRKMKCKVWEWLASIDSAQNDLHPNVSVAKDGSLRVAFLVETAGGDPTFYDYGNVESSIGPMPYPGTNFKVVAILTDGGVWVSRAYYDEPSVEAGSNADKNFTYLCTERVNNSTFVANSSAGLAVEDVDYQAIVYYNSDSTTRTLDGTALAAFGNVHTTAKLTENGIWQWLANIIAYDNNINAAVPIVCQGMGCDNSHAYLSFVSGIDQLTYDYFDKDDVSRKSDAYGAVGGGAPSLLTLVQLSCNGYWGWSAHIQYEAPTFNEHLTQRNTLVAEDAIYVSVANMGDGGFTQSVLFDSDGVSRVTPRNSATDLYAQVLKIDKLGYWQWAANIEGFTAGGMYSDVVSDSKGNLYVSLNLEGSGDVISFYHRDGTLAFTNVAVPAGLAHCVIKLNSDGFWEWRMNVHNRATGIQTLRINSRDELVIEFMWDTNVSTFAQLIGKDDVLAYSFPVFTTARNIQVRLTTDGFWRFNSSIDLGSTTLVSPSIGSFASEFDSAENLFVAVDTIGTPKLYDRDGETCISGRATISHQICIAKQGSQSANSIIGIVDTVSNGRAAIQVGGEAKYSPGGLVSGCTYYLDCLAFNGLYPLLTTSRYDANDKENPLLGVATASNKILLR